MQSSGEAGVVVVTFGSMVTHLTSESAEVFAAAFGRLPQKVARVSKAIFKLGCREKMIQKTNSGLELGINTSEMASY